MLKLLAKLFGMNKAEETKPEAAPYKVEAPAPAVTPVAQQATEAAVKSVAPAKKAPKKPAAAKAGGSKKPRKPKSKTQA